MAVENKKKGGIYMATLTQQMINYRAKNNLSQSACASMCGISHQTWYSVENGRQNPSKVTEAKIRLLINENNKED